jgi:hypothetical protein
MAELPELQTHFGLVKGCLVETREDGVQIMLAMGATCYLQPIVGARGLEGTEAEGNGVVSVKNTVEDGSAVQAGCSAPQPQPLEDPRLRRAASGYVSLLAAANPDSRNPTEPDSIFDAALAFFDALFFASYYYGDGNGDKTNMEEGVDHCADLARIGVEELAILKKFYGKYQRLGERFNRAHDDAFIRSILNQARRHARTTEELQELLHFDYAAHYNKVTSRLQANELISVHTTTDY